MKKEVEDFKQLDRIDMCPSCRTPMKVFYKKKPEMFGIKQYGPETHICTNPSCHMRISEDYIKRSWTDIKEESLTEDKRKIINEKISGDVVERYGELYETK